MPIQPYVLVLAQTSHEGATYVRRAKLPRGRWRVVARASSIRGIRKAEVHILPGFHRRPDRHSILGELRYAQCEMIDVEMPPRETPAPVDQGDGMGEQLTIDDAAPVAMPTVSSSTPPVEMPTIEAPGAGVDEERIVAERPKRRSKCSDCGTLHFKDEPCTRIDGVEEAPVVTPATMFD